MTKEKFDFVCYAFVDDTDLVHSSPPDLEIREMVSEMQAVVDTWEGGLRASGGALVPSKSYWYLIHFTFQKNKWSYSNIEETPGSLSIREVSGPNRVTLDRLEVSEARETLGVFIAMDGNHNTQTAEFLKIAHRWSNRVRSSCLLRMEAWFSLNLCIMKSLEYLLMAPSLSQKQCETIMQPILNAALPALGFNRWTLRKVVYGPRKYQGIGIQDLWTLQGIVKLWIALAHGDAHTITGCALRAVLALHTIELGLPGSMIKQNYKKFSHLATSSWLKHLWGFCQGTNIHLEPPTPTMALIREHDEYVMQQFASFGYQGKDLYHLNLCQLWCHAVRLSDITTGDGSRIHPLAWNGNPMEDAGSEFAWPRHGCPTTKCWKLWQAALRLCFLTLHMPQQMLRRPLGRWLVPTDQTGWTWFQSHQQSRVYHRQDNNTDFNVYSIIATRRRLCSPKYTATGTGESLPADAECTTVTQHVTFIRFHGSKPSSYKISIQKTIKEHMSDQDQWAIRSLESTRNGANIAQSIIQGNAIAICDGSYKDQFGTAAFVIQRGASRASRILGANVTPGHPEEQNPYRSEVGGIFAIVITVEALTKVFDIQDGTIEVGCDCESGLTAIFEHEYDTPSQPHHDMIHEIQKKIALSPIKWKFRHVRGHQDKHIQAQYLDLWSQLNVEMDSLAKSYWNETQTVIEPFYPPNTFGWSLWIEERKLSNWNRHTLYNDAMAHDILDHWSNRRKIPENMIHSIDWEASESASKRLGLNRSLWIPKWLAGFAPVGKVLQRYKFQEHTECPRCTEFEDTNHIVTCKAPRATIQWEASISNLEQWLNKAYTMPDIRKAIVSRLRSWRAGNELQATSHTWPGVNDLIQDQDKIGWRTFLEGGILQKWAAKQQEYYTWLQRRNTGRRWTTTLIKKMWEISWNMWEQRNSELKNPESPASIREHARLDARINQEYNDTLTLTLKDRWWFRRTKEVIATETIAYKQQWLESVGLA